MGPVISLPYTCRHCGQTVEEWGHASVCPALDVAPALVVDLAVYRAERAS